MSIIPDFIVHYSRGEPFRSLTSLSFEQRDAVIASLNESTAWGLNRFQDPDYLGTRLAVEKKLYEQFVSLGGQPQIKTPIYFFLGRNERFEQHPANRAYLIDLRNIPERYLSFTYGDSMFGFDQDLKNQMGGSYQSPLCGKLFLKSQLFELIQQLESVKENRLHIEVQVWVQPSVEMVQRSAMSTAKARTTPEMSDDEPKGRL